MVSPVSKPARCAGESRSTPAILHSLGMRESSVAGVSRRMSWRGAAHPASPNKIAAPAARFMTPILLHQHERHVHRSAVHERDLACVGADRNQLAEVVDPFP